MGDSKEVARRKESERVKEVAGWIRDDMKWRNEWAEADHWQRWDDYYRGHFPGDDGRINSKIIPVNVFFPHIRTFIPQTMFYNPSVTVGSNMPTSGVKGKILQHLDKWLIRKLGFKNEARMSSQDCFTCGTGFLKHGYDSEFGLSEQFMGQSHLGDDDELLEYSTNVIPGLPWTLRCHPSDVLLPWGCTSPKNLRRIIFRSLRLLKDVKADPKYRSSVTRKMKAGTVRLDLSDNKPVKTEEEWVWIYRTHDLREGIVMVTSDGVKEFLQDEDDVLVNTIRGAPVSFVSWNPNSRSVWGVPEAKILERTQIEANTISTLAARSRKASVPKWAIEREGLTEEALKNFESEEVHAIVQTEGPPRDMMMELKATGEPYLALELQRVIAQGRQQVGFAETRAGSFTAPAKRVTGREVDAVESGADIQAGIRREAVGDALEDTVEKWNHLIFRFWDQLMWIRAPDIDPSYEFIIFTGRDLRGKYDYQIDSEEMRPPNHQEKQNEAAFLAPQLLKVAAELPNLVDAPSIIGEVLARFPGWDVHAGTPKGQRQSTGKAARLDPSGFLVPMERTG